MNNITFDTITEIKTLIDQVVKTIVNLKEADFGNNLLTKKAYAA